MQRQSPNKDNGKSQRKPPVFKNEYIGLFLETLSTDSMLFSRLVDTYENAFAVAMKNAKFEAGAIVFEDGASSATKSMERISKQFTDKSFDLASEFCRKVREVVKQFERKKFGPEIEITNSNIDFWRMRMEEVFFLKLLCLESLNEKNDSLLVEFVGSMACQANVNRASYVYVFFHPSANNFDSLLDDIPVVHNLQKTHKLNCTLGTKMVSTPRGQSDDSKALVKLQEDHQKTLIKLKEAKKVYKELEKAKKKNLELEEKIQNMEEELTDWNERFLAKEEKHEKDKAEMNEKILLLQETMQTLLSSPQLKQIQKEAAGAIHSAPESDEEGESVSSSEEKEFEEINLSEEKENNKFNFPRLNLPQLNLPQLSQSNTDDDLPYAVLSPHLKLKTHRSEGDVDEAIEGIEKNDDQEKSDNRSRLLSSQSIFQNKDGKGVDLCEGEQENNRLKRSTSDNTVRTMFEVERVTIKSTDPLHARKGEGETQIMRKRVFSVTTKK